MFLSLLSVLFKSMWMDRLAWARSSLHAVPVGSLVSWLRRAASLPMSPSRLRIVAMFLGMESFSIMRARRS